MAYIITFAVFAALVAALLLGARRFAARQRRLGRWDEFGPLEETQGPPHAIGGNMSERLEVVGEWKGEVLRRRQPHEPPDKGE
jgi:hypothetical protein